MKKNKMMRLASFMLVATLLSTSVISGTFAKYITTDSAQDEARVAKFGVIASVSGDLFGATYKSVGEGNTIDTYAVNGGTVSSDGNASDFVVAPGTKNDTGMTIEVKGIPEVKTTIHYDAMEDNADKNYANAEIYLGEGTYGTMIKYTGVKTDDNQVKYYKFTAGNGTDSGKFEKMTAGESAGDWYELVNGTDAVGEKYYPVRWSLAVINSNGAETDSAMTAVSDGRLTAVQTELDKINGLTFAPNKNNAVKATVTWKWDYGTAWVDGGTGVNLENTTDIDKKDTILGYMMADSNDAKVVKLTPGGTTYTEVLYHTVNAAVDSANQIKVAYAGAQPTAANDASICACLTVAFNGRLTVEQVD